MTDPLAEYEENLLKSQELLVPEKPLDEQWSAKYGTSDRKIANHRSARQEVIRDLMASQGHHLKFAEHIHDIEVLDMQEHGSSLELQKLKTLAELRLKAMGKYVPDVKAVSIDVTPDAQDTAHGLSRAAEILGNIAAGIVERDDERVVQGGSVVSTQVRSEEEGS